MQSSRSIPPYQKSHSIAPIHQKKAKSNTMKKRAPELELVLIIVPSSANKLEQSKIASLASAAYSANYDNVFGKKDAKHDLN